MKTNQCKQGKVIALYMAYFFVVSLMSYDNNALHKERRSK